MLDSVQRFMENEFGEQIPTNPESLLKAIDKLKYITLKQIQCLDYYRQTINPDCMRALSQDEFKALSDKEKMLYILSTNNISNLGNFDCNEFIPDNYKDIDADLIRDINVTLAVAKKISTKNLENIKQNFIVKKFEWDKGHGYRFCLNLQGANLQDANLSGAKFYNANLRDANLKGANLQNANLHDANLQGANLREANLQSANLQSANLEGASLWLATLDEAQLQEAELQDANLRDANLKGANLREANLQGANLHGAYLHGANLREANLHDANLRGASLYSATLKDTSLKNAQLQGANLNTTFTSANLTYCNIRLAKYLKFLFETASEEALNQLTFFDDDDFQSTAALELILNQYEENKEDLLRGDFFKNISDKMKSKLRLAIVNSLIRQVNEVKDENNNDKIELLQVAFKHPFFRRQDNWDTISRFFSDEQKLVTSGCQKILENEIKQITKNSANNNRLHSKHP